MRTKTWTGYAENPKYFRYGAAVTWRKPDPRFRVPLDVRVQSVDELLKRGRLPVPRVAQLVLQPAKEAFARTQASSFLDTQIPCRDS